MSQAAAAISNSCFSVQRGNTLIDTRSLLHFSEDAVKVRFAALADQWQFLVQKSAEKSQKLKEANKQQNFNTGIKDSFDFSWLSEVEALFASERLPEGPGVCEQSPEKAPAAGSWTSLPMRDGLKDLNGQGRQPDDQQCFRITPPRVKDKRQLRTISG
uniref:Uncharacterized protein n=1 Tax=Sphaerodactylus townsendi TaxID=933632 RepID=A0ACB8EZR9_9SAUR